MNRAFLGTGSDYAPPISRHKIFMVARATFRIGPYQTLRCCPKSFFHQVCEYQNPTSVPLSARRAPILTAFSECTRREPPRSPA